jgi:hypothetical protein
MKATLRVALAASVLLGLLPAVGNGQQPVEPEVKRGLTDADRQYTMPAGVTVQEVTYFSEGVGCYAKLFYPMTFTTNDKRAAVVLANGWAGTHNTLEKYAARFAEQGLVAMAIDYRGWGNSRAFVTLAAPYRTDDALRFTEATAKVRLKRTRLLPLKQVEDIRNAVSYLQGEPGVDRDRIGLWGTSYAGGHVIVTAATDARVKAGVAQVPAIGGKNTPEKAFMLTDALLQDAIKRARTGQGGQYETGFSKRRMIDVETRQMTREYQPFHYVEQVPETVPILFIVAENEELINNQNNAYAASKALKGSSKVIAISAITHFEMYVGDAFETGANAAAEWFLTHLGNEQR